MATGKAIDGSVCVVDADHTRWSWVVTLELADGTSRRVNADRTFSTQTQAQQWGEAALASLLNE